MPRPKQVSSLEISQVSRQPQSWAKYSYCYNDNTDKNNKIKNFISIYYTNQLGLALATKL